mgnify:CR=1 FL=1
MARVKEHHLAVVAAAQQRVHVFGVELEAHQRRRRRQRKLGRVGVAYMTMIDYEKKREKRGVALHVLFCLLFIF